MTRKGACDSGCSICVLTWLLSISITVAVISTAIALPVYFAAYKVQLSRNGRLTKSECTITDYTISEKICQRECNCYTHYDEYTKRHSTRCSSCPYTCFGWTRYAEYTLERDGDDEGEGDGDERQGDEYNVGDYNETETTTQSDVSGEKHRYIEAYGTSDFRSSAVTSAESKPAGSQWTCYYDPNDLSLVRSSYYNTSPLLGFCIFLFVLMGVSIAICFFTGPSLLICCTLCDDANRDSDLEGYNRRQIRDRELDDVRDYYRDADAPKRERRESKQAPTPLGGRSGVHPLNATLSPTL